MMLVVGAQNDGWNKAYKAGYWVAFITIALNGLGYLCLTLCMAEMSSALPFSGGIYGYVRATSGPFFGYMVACFELLMNVSYVSSNFAALAEIPHKAKVMNQSDTPFFVFMLYAGALIFTLVGGKPFWLLSSLLGLTALFIILIYIFGSCKNADFEKYADIYTEPTPYHVMTYMYSTCVQYMGIQYVPILGQLCKEPRKQVPQMMIFCIIVCIITAMGLQIVAAAHYPGATALSARLYPLTWNFAPILNVDIYTTIWLNFPGLFGSTLGFIYCYGHQIAAISKTGLLPSVFQKTIPYLDTPYIALMMGFTICFIINITAIYYPFLINDVQEVSTLATCIVFIFAFVNYILFKKNFSVLQRTYTNPFREVSAFIGIGIFIMVITSAIFYQGPGWTTTQATLVYGACCAIFYLYWHKHQVFSEEEKKNMFQAYLINGKMICFSFFLKQ